MTTCDWSNHQPFLQLSPEVRKRRQFQRPLTPSLRKISGPVIMMSSSSSSWVRPQNPSPNLKVALAYLSALEQCDERKLMDTFDDTLEHRILPKSLGRPVLNKEHFGNYFQSIASMFERGSSRVSLCIFFKISLYKYVCSGSSMKSLRRRTLLFCM